MSDVPDIRYAKNGDVHLAYQVFGKGARDIVFIWGPFSNLEVIWEYGPARRLLEGLAGLGRVIQFDRRGTGLSDRSGELPILEEQMDDVIAVLDAVGAERVALIGGGDASLMVTLFAATHPERTSALILSAPRVRLLVDDDFPWGTTVEDWEALRTLVTAEWGTGVSQAVAAPSTLGDDSVRQWWARVERQSLSPGGVNAMLGVIGHADVRPVLGHDPRARPHRP